MCRESYLRIYDFRKCECQVCLWGRAPPARFRHADGATGIPARAPELSSSGGAESLATQDSKRLPRRVASLSLFGQVGQPGRFQIARLSYDAPGFSSFPVCRVVPFCWEHRSEQGCLHAPQIVFLFTVVLRAGAELRRRRVRVATESGVRGLVHRFTGGWSCCCRGSQGGRL
jgi:hypothetical protein